MLGEGYTHPDSIGKNSSALRIANRLRQTARGDTFTGTVPNNIWGAGKLDVRAALAPVMGLRFTGPKRNTVFPRHWGQASVISDSTTLNSSLDKVVVVLATDGCTFADTVMTLTNLGVNRSYTFLFKTPAATSRARLLAYGVKGTRTVEVLSDGPFEFAFPTVTGTEDVTPLRRLTLHSSSPNPFNPETLIRFETASESVVGLRIFSVDGRVVRTLLHQVLPGGTYEVRWDGRTDRGELAASGVFFCELSAEGKRLHSKMTLLR
jgi:hypothetical protein